MGTEIAQCAATRQPVDVTPGDRQMLVEQLILIVGAGEAHDLAERTGLHQLAHISIRRVHGIIKADIIDDALFAASSASSLDSSAEMDSGFSQ